MAFGIALYKNLLQLLILLFAARAALLLGRLPPFTFVSLCESGAGAAGLTAGAAAVSPSPSSSSLSSSKILMRFAYTIIKNAVLIQQMKKLIRSFNFNAIIVMIIERYAETLLTRWLNGSAAFRRLGAEACSSSSSSSSSSRGGIPCVC